MFAPGELAPRLASEFAALRVRPTKGDQPRNGRHPHGAEVWLVGEHRASGEKKHYLANLPSDATLDKLAATIKAALGRASADRPCGNGQWRCHEWMCVPAHQQLKEELGLDHFEGRSWIGLHRLTLMTMVTFAFLQHLRLQERGKTPRTGGAAGAAAETVPAGLSAQAA